MLKFELLERLAEELKKLKKNELTDRDIELVIAKNVGISDYVINNIKKKLHRFGFIVPTNSGWKVNDRTKS